MVQEAIQRNTRDGSSSKIDDEENCALESKAKKGKGKVSHSKSDSCHEGKKNEMSKVKFLHCHELGNFSTNCLLKKSMNKSSRGATRKALVSQFKLNFTFIACIMSSMMHSVWYLDSGASFHMTSNKKLFSDLEEKDLQMHIDMGDDGRYSSTGLGTFTFQRDSGAPLIL